MNEQLASLLARFEERAYKDINIGDGWVSLVTKLDETLAALDPNYTILQVKEKFGGLRYYASTSPDYVGTGDWITDPFHTAISVAEAVSFTICEECGSTGTTRSGGWTRTLCDDHANKEQP